MNYILDPGPHGKSTWPKVNIANGLTGKMCSVMRRGLSVSPVCASLYGERSPNESFHSVILCDYRSGCPYRGNSREGERRRSGVTEVSLSSGCTVWSVECATMATLKRHICFCQSSTASHQVSVTLSVRTHACPFSVTTQPDLMHLSLVCVHFQWIVVMYLCFDSGVRAGVTKRLCVCVWARSELSHCSPALTCLRLRYPCYHSATHTMIAFVSQSY